MAGRHTIYSQEVLMVLPWLGRFGSSKGEVNFIVYTDGIVVIWEMEIEPTPMVRLLPCGLAILLLGV